MWHLFAVERTSVSWQTNALPLWKARLRRASAKEPCHGWAVVWPRCSSGCGGVSPQGKHKSGIGNPVLILQKKKHDEKLYKMKPSLLSIPAHLPKGIQNSSLSLVPGWGRCTARSGPREEVGTKGGSGVSTKHSKERESCLAEGSQGYQGHHRPDAVDASEWRSCIGIPLGKVILWV